MKEGGDSVIGCGDSNSSSACIWLGEVYYKFPIRSFYKTSFCGVKSTATFLRPLSPSNGVSSVTKVSTVGCTWFFTDPPLVVIGLGVILDGEGVVFVCDVGFAVGVTPSYLAESALWQQPILIFKFD